MTHQPVRYSDTLIFPASLDPDAVTVVSRLNEAGLESYFVGGCVRDLLVGLIPKDFDVSTAARPRQIRRLFRNSRIIGRRFKLAHVHFGDNVIEVATFRQPPEADAEIDGEDADLLIRRDNVFGTAEEDVIRRDFTINALLYDLRTSEVIDYVGGVEDLRMRVLRTIGDPCVRFAEDPVRMLRAVKFLSRLEMHPSPETDAAMRECADLIERSAPPRVIEEIYKLMSCGKAARALSLFREYGLLGRLLPEIAPAWAARADELEAMGAALDRLDHGQRKLDNAFLLACLFLPAWRDRLAADEAHDPVAAIRDLITPVAMRMSMPRRDVGVVKALLANFSRFENPPRNRRFRMKEFLARASTRRALDLLYVAALAGFVDPELHAEWAQRAGDVEVEAAPDDDLPPREGGRRKRRRSGRRRSRSGNRQPKDPEQDADQLPQSEASQPDDVRSSDGEADPEGAQTRAPREDGPGSKRPRRRGRRGGRRRRKPREGAAGAGAPEDGEAGDSHDSPEGPKAPAEARPAPKADAPTTDGERPSRRRKRSRKARKPAPAGRRASQPARREKSKVKAKDDDDDALQPGQRHPEDIEDYFDW